MRSVLPLPVAIQNATLFSCCRASADFVQGLHAISLLDTCVELGDVLVHRLQQFPRAVEVPVQVDLREEQREVLEVLPRDRTQAPRDASLVEAPGHRRDRLVVRQEHIVRQARSAPRRQVHAQRLVEAVDVVLVQPLKRLLPQVASEVVEAGDAEEPQKPLVQYQSLGEGKRQSGLGGHVTGNMAVALASRTRVTAKMTRRPRDAEHDRQDGFAAIRDRQDDQAATERRM